MSYLPLGEAAQFVERRTGHALEPAGLLRAGVMGLLRIVAAFSGPMRNLSSHIDDDYLGHLAIPRRHLLEIETYGETIIQGAFGLDGLTAYSPQVKRSREQLRLLVADLEPFARSLVKIELQQRAELTNYAPAKIANWQRLAQSQAWDIILRQRAKDLYPSQTASADEIARVFRADAIVGKGGKPLTGAYIKRHALKGISSEQAKQLSTSPRRGK